MPQTIRNGKQLFSIEEELLRGELGREIIGIYHVGSTSIPGLLSKPIIDIAVESSVFPPSHTIIRKLELLGYQNKGQAGVPERYWFTKGEPRKFNLHYCGEGSAVIKNQITFRDKLIESFQLRNMYEKIKLENYKDRDIDSAEYSSSKSAFIENVLNLK